MRDVFNKSVLERIAPLWDKDMSVISKWSVLRVNTGKALLGRDCRHQPDWIVLTVYNLL